MQRKKFIVEETAEKINKAKIIDNLWQKRIHLGINIEGTFQRYDTSIKPYLKLREEIFGSLIRKR